MQLFPNSGLVWSSAALNAIHLSLIPRQMDEHWFKQSSIIGYGENEVNVGYLNQNATKQNAYNTFRNASQIAIMP